MLRHTLSFLPQSRVEIIIACLIAALTLLIFSL